MSDKKFDRLLSEIRNEQVDEQVISRASERVWSSITSSPAADLSMHTLRSCEDFQALIPAYLGKTLPEAGNIGSRGRGRHQAGGVSRKRNCLVGLS